MRVEVPYYQRDGGILGYVCVDKAPLHLEWKRINHKQSARWHHLYQLKASAFFSFF